MSCIIEQSKLTFSEVWIIQSNDIVAFQNHSRSECLLLFQSKNFVYVKRLYCVCQNAQDRHKIVSI
jgi:hypothetical protein